MKSSEKINHLEKLTINHNEQWVHVRGENRNAPLLIHVQAGPGLPMIPEANALEKLLGFEKNYLVAYWDQRGCGKSFSRHIDPQTITLSQLADDIISCTRYLLKRYNKNKAILVGYSIGATTSLLAAAQNASLFSELFLVGVDIDLPKANSFALEFAKTKAQRQNNRKLLHQIEDLAARPIIDSKRFQQRAKILTNLGGIQHNTTYNQLLISTLRNFLFSKEYTLSDIPRAVQGMDFCQDALLTELDAFNLFAKVKSVDVPVHFFQGKLDGIAPYETAVSFYNYLQAPYKTFTDFNHSAHMIAYDDPELFAKMVNEKIQHKQATSATPI